MKETILQARFVPVEGNWRVFIRLMDMKRKKRGDEGRIENREG